MRLRILTGLLLLLFANSLFAQAPDSFPKSPPSGFIENKGQIIDQNHHPNTDVLYLLNTPGFNVQLRKTGWSYDLYEKRYEGMKALRHEATAMRQEGEDQGAGLRAQGRMSNYDSIINYQLSIITASTSTSLAAILVVK